MQVALIANTAWLDEELATLHHLVVGLLDESVRVVQVLPMGRAEGEVVSFGQRLSWRERSGTRRNRRALNRLAEPLQKQGVELIHALDGRQWRAALDLGRQLNVPVALSANSGMDVELAARLANRLVPGSHALLCATGPLTQLIDQAIGSVVPVRHVPFGVHVGKSAGRSDDETPCIVISGDGGFDDHVQRLLQGAKQAIEARPDLQLFFDTQRDHPRALWRAINRIGLLANATLIPRRLGHRELLLRAGALVHPQPLGRARSLTLRAMSHAVPVLACADPLLDDFIDGQTAKVLHDPSAESWAKVIIGVANDPGPWHELGISAQQWVGQNRLASMQLDHLIATYRQLTGEPIAFPGQAQAS
jgi:glycosyltransferase involved in cell wall biosynthesis